MPTKLSVECVRICFILLYNLIEQNSYITHTCAIVHYTFNIKNIRIIHTYYCIN